jgi:hypothetical protein
VSPLPQHCTLPAHEKATLPLSLLPLPWPSPLQLPSPSPSPLLTLLPLQSLLAIAHCRCHGHWLLPLRLPSTIAASVLSHFRQPLPLPTPLPLLLPLAIADSVTVGHHSCHLCWPSLLPLLLAISESCCLGAVRIIFKQFKQRKLTLFIL